MCRWFATHYLSLDVLKTSELSIIGVGLERARVATFLAVLIDEQLSWKPHITSVQNTLSKTTAILYNCSQIVDSCAMRILY